MDSHFHGNDNTKIEPKMTTQEKKMPPGVDFCDDKKSQQTNPFKSRHLLYGVGLHGIHGFLQYPNSGICKEQENRVKERIKSFISIYYIKNNRPRQKVENC